MLTNVRVLRQLIIRFDQRSFISVKLDVLNYAQTNCRLVDSVE